jgi:asparagine synthase (glutamine-hydrolysing)
MEDKLSMAHGLENRVPFLDNDLVDFAMRVPVSLKLGNLREIVRLNENEPGPKTQKFFQKSQDGKLLLREVMQRYIPDTVTGCAKQGFSAPDATWFKGDSIQYVREKFSSKNAYIYSFLDKNTLTQLISEHMEGKQNRRLLIWSLLCVEEWLRDFFGGENEG